MSVKKIEAVSNTLNRIALLVSVLLLAVMAAVVAANVLSRYVLHVPLTWSAELARYGMVWSAMLAAAAVAGKRQHLTVDLLERWLSRKLRRPLRVFVAFVCMTFFGVMLISGLMLVARTSGQVASSVEKLPISVVYLVMPVSALLMLFGSVVLVLRLVYEEEPG